jgi:hypothetical protein
VKVLGFNGSYGPSSLPGNGGNTQVKPAVCATATHLAGTGETAVIGMGATAIPNPAANDTLYIDAMYSMDGGNPLNVEALGLSSESMADGIANASTFVRMPLQAGHTYQFRAGLASNGSVQLPANGAYCQGTVMIVRSGG